MEFRRAVKSKAKARIGLIGPSGSGKTYTALVLATNLGQRVAVIDTENGSAAKYADEFTFDHLCLDSFAPKTYVEAIRLAERAGYDVVVVDSLSHAWVGKEGALEMVDKAAVRYQGNTFAAWRDVTPHHNALVDALVRCNTHLIATMRSKTAYEIVDDPKTGRKVPRKVGLQPIQRDGMEYEFDIVAEMDMDNRLIVAKTRCRALNGAVIEKPGPDLAQTIAAWLSDGAEPGPAPAPQASPPAPSPTPQAAAGNGQKRGRQKDRHLERIMAAQEYLHLSADELSARLQTLFGNGKTYKDLTDEERSGFADEIEGLVLAGQQPAAAG